MKLRTMKLISLYKKAAWTEENSFDLPNDPPPQELMSEGGLIWMEKEKSAIVSRDDVRLEPRPSQFEFNPEKKKGQLDISSREVYGNISYPEKAVSGLVESPPYRGYHYHQIMESMYGRDYDEPKKVTSIESILSKHDKESTDAAKDILNLLVRLKKSEKDQEIVQSYDKAIEEVKSARTNHLMQIIPEDNRFYSILIFKIHFAQQITKEEIIHYYDKLKYGQSLDVFSYTGDNKEELSEVARKDSDSLGGHYSYANGNLYYTNSLIPISHSTENDLKCLQIISKCGKLAKEDKLNSITFI